MNLDIAIIGAIVIAACLIAGVGYYLRQIGIERRRWARYSDYRGGEPKSVACPHCRKRNYSLRAIRERVCVHCNRGY